MPEKKERTTQIERAHFTFDSGALCNGEVSEVFQRALYDSMKTPRASEQMFRRVGGICDSISLNLSVSPEITTDPVRPIDIPRFASDALKAIKDYRAIHVRNTGIELGTYIIEQHAPHDKGKYVWVREGEPMFEIEIGNKGSYITGPMAFRELDGIGTLQYTPRLEGEHPYEVSIETTVAKRANGKREQLTKRLFIDFHKKLVQKHRDKKMTLTE